MAYQRAKQLGFTVGIAGVVFVGYMTNAGQYVAGAVFSTAQAGAGLTGGTSIDIGAGDGLTSTADTVDVVCGAGMTCAANSVDVIATSGGGLTVSANDIGITTCSNAGERQEWDGSAYQCRYRNDYRSKHLESHNEFWTSNAGPEFSGATSGTGAANGAITGLGRPGILDSQTGTTSTGLARFNNNSSHPFSQSSQVIYEWTGGVPVLSTSSEEYALTLGLISDVGTVNQTNGCFFAYDRGNVMTNGANSGNLDNLSCWCANNGSRTTFVMAGTGNSDESFALGNAPVAAATLPNTNIYGLKIVVTGTTRAEFYRDVGAGYVKMCNINTNLPSTDARGTLASIQIIKSNGGTTMHLYSDRLRYAVDLTAARSP